MQISAIVAVDSNWGIGYKNQLLFKIKDDLQRFKEITKDSIVVMGRETFESLGEPLSNRLNIVLSTKPQKYEFDNVIVVNSVSQLISMLKFVDMYRQIYVIGGQSVYEQLLPYCEYIYVTKVKKEFKADKFFPNLDNCKYIREWKNDFEADEGEPYYYCDEETGLEYTYVRYENNKLAEV